MRNNLIPSHFHWQHCPGELFPMSAWDPDVARVALAAGRQPAYFFTEEQVRPLEAELAAALKTLHKLRDDGLCTADLQSINSCRNKAGYFRLWMAVDKFWFDRFGQNNECTYHGQYFHTGKTPLSKPGCECHREIKLGEILEVELEWEEHRSYRLLRCGEWENFDVHNLDDEYDHVGRLYSSRDAALLHLKDEGIAFVETPEPEKDNDE